MGKLSSLYLAILAVFLAAALAGCVLEVTTGSIRFNGDEPLDQEVEIPPDGESPPAGLTPR